MKYYRRKSWNAVTFKPSKLKIKNQGKDKMTKVTDTKCRKNKDIKAIRNP